MMCPTLLVMVLVSAVHGHMRFVCPRPESGNSGIKTGPCSKEGNTFEDNYADITPGPLTLRFEETIVHGEAPLRLTLNKYGDAENICMLLDQYPHNENGTMNIGSECNPFDWDLGGCKAQHHVTVNIPDIRCDKCFLQLVSVMTDKYTDTELPCHQIDQANNNCSSYYSCANVKIRPTEAGQSKDISTCVDYKSNLVGDWPYRPRELYQAEMTGAKVLTATADFDLLEETLIVTLPRGTVSGMDLSAEFLQGETSLGSVAVNDHIVEWNVPKEHQALLRANQVVLSLKHNAKPVEVTKGTLTLTEKKFERDYYRRHGVDLTPAGWLQEPEFVGASATYPFAMEPHGSCVRDTTYYGASTVDASGDHAAVVTVTQTDLHAWVRAASTGRPLVSVSLVSTEAAVPPLELPKNLFSDDGHHFSGVLDMTGVVRSGEFFDTVKMKLGPESDTLELTVPLTESTVASIMYGSECVGEAIFEVVSGSLSYTAVVNFADDSPLVVSSMSINGPARNTMSAEQLISLTAHSTAHGGYSKGTGQVLDVVVLDALHAALLYVDVQTEEGTAGSRVVSGQLTPKKECRASGNTCFSTTLTVGGGALNRYKQSVDTNGYATFRHSSDKLDYKITLRDVKGGETVDRVYAETPDKSFLLHQGAFTTSTLEDNVQVFKGTLDNPSSEVLDALGRGNLGVSVYTDIYNLEPIYGKLPPITCIDTHAQL